MFPLTAERGEPLHSKHQNLSPPEKDTSHCHKKRVSGRGQLCLPYSVEAISYVESFSVVHCFASLCISPLCSRRHITFSWNLPPYTTFWKYLLSLHSTHPLMRSLRIELWSLQSVYSLVATLFSIYSLFHIYFIPPCSKLISYKRYFFERITDAIKFLAWLDPRSVTCKGILWQRFSGLDDPVWIKCSVLWILHHRSQMIAINPSPYRCIF